MPASPPARLAPGCAAAAEMLVTDAETAVVLRTGDVPVLGTPAIVRLAEEASVAAVHDRLEPGTTTVGHRVQLDHLAPSPVGATVRAEALLETVEGRRLTFRISVSDSRGLVAAGRVTRVVVERERFIEKAGGS